MGDSRQANKPWSIFLTLAQQDGDPSFQGAVSAVDNSGLMLWWQSRHSNGAEGPFSSQITLTLQHSWPISALICLLF